MDYFKCTKCGDYDTNEGILLQQATSYLKSTDKDVCYSCLKDIVKDRVDYDVFESGVNDFDEFVKHGNPLDKF